MLHFFLRIILTQRRGEDKKINIKKSSMLHFFLRIILTQGRGEDKKIDSIK